jgi:hypothetical protein
VSKHSAQYLLWSNSEVARADIDQYRAKGQHYNW